MWRRSITVMSRRSISRFWRRVGCRFMVSRFMVSRFMISRFMVSWFMIIGFGWNIGSNRLMVSWRVVRLRFMVSRLRWAVWCWGSKVTFSGWWMVRFGFMISRLRLGIMVRLFIWILEMSNRGMDGWGGMVVAMRAVIFRHFVGQRHVFELCNHSFSSLFVSSETHGI